MNLTPSTVAILYLSERILSLFSVRIHTQIVSHGGAWVKLWYLLRGIDTSGCGFCRVTLADVCQILRASSSTVREWLREGKRAGAFYQWWVRRGILTCHSVSLPRLISRLGLKSWGDTGEIPLLKINNYRAYASAISTLALQHRSTWAARRALARSEQKIYSVPDPADFFKAPTEPSSKPIRGVPTLPCVLHISSKRVFVSSGFIPLGASQRGIARERGVTERTIRRHQTIAALQKRQICQAKAAYSYIATGLKFESPFIHWGEGVQQYSAHSLRYWNEKEPSFVMHEPNGISSKSRCTSNVRRERFFRYGDKTWMYRCNVYSPDIHLCSMKFARWKYKRSSRHCNGQNQGLHKSFTNGPGDAVTGAETRAAVDFVCI